MIIRYPIARTASLVTFCFTIVFIFSIHTLAQEPLTAEPKTPDPVPTPTPRPANELEKKFFVNLLQDQGAIWTSPFHLVRGDAKWGIPLTVSAAALFATDRHTSGALVENGDNLSRLRISNDISQLGAFYTTGGIAAGFYIAGRATHNARARETGVLAAEALLNSSIVVEALKTVSQRQRPPTDNSSGEFFDGGSSFPSGHAISAWALATVIAEEYGQHRPWMRFGLYGLATAVAVSRYTGRNHFLSDVLLGSAMGYGIGRFVYHQHHDPTLDSLSDKQSNGFIHSRLFPSFAPLYNAQAHSYGATLAWAF